jgi:N-acetylglucosaminyldiphosphoundecaprenol N-acetyl-beta-D-mannosaminyltransferase
MIKSKQKRINILGTKISAINITQTIQTIRDWIASKDSNYICVVPAHSIMQAYRDQSLREIINLSGLSTPDGMAIVWLLHLQGYQNVDRVYGPDLMNAVCKHSLETGWKHYFFGGAPGIAEQLSERLNSQYPELQITGTYSPPFRDLSQQEDEEIIANINHAQPDIVWVGLGSPKQEFWMHNHLSKLDAPVLIGVGAAFDFLSGNKRQAPRWIQRSGFEWLFRLASEPQRLWRRYAEYPLFVLLVLLQILHLKKFENGKQF